MATNWVGLDVHEEFCVAAVRDDAGKSLREARIRSRRAELRRFFRSLGPETEGAFEAGGSWPWIYDTVAPLVRRVALVHPLKTRLIAEAMIKNDRLDAGHLSHLLRGHLLFEAYAAPPRAREGRQLTRGRVRLVRGRAAMSVRIRALMRLHGVEPPAEVALFGERGRVFLRALALPPNARRTLNSYLSMIEAFDAQIEEFDAAILEWAKGDAMCELLETIPGIGPFTAVLLSSEIGDPRRFASAGKLCAWAGLVPRLYSSGELVRHGPLTKQGNSWIRWVLCECATAAVRSCERFRRLYKRVQARSGKSCARAAVAREILTVAYAMMRTGEVFDPQRGMRPGPEPQASAPPQV